MGNSNDQIAADNFCNYTAEAMADIFVTKLVNNQFKIDTIPNKFTDYTGYLEFKDYRDYNTLLKSRAGLLFIKSL